VAGAQFCGACGKALREGARFCDSCGHVASDAAVATTAPAPPPEPPAAPPVPAPVPPPAPGAPLSGPPSGPPPAGPPQGPLGAAGAAGSGGGSNRKLIVGLAAAVVVALIAVAVVLVMGGGGDKTASKKDREVLLESTASAGPAPFMPSLQPVSATVPTTVTTTPPVTAAPTPSGRVAQGPFGGTGDNTLCDRELLVQFLTTPSNAAIAREWARVLDIQVSQIPTYVRALIPTTLTADARVTNHTWQNGRAVGYQAVLERGTAVLVDTNGRLIARCRCGNPLLPPQEVQGPPIYTGPKWEGFDPTVIVIVVPSPQPIYPPGGVGTLPQTTTPKTTTTGKPSTTTTVLAEPDEAIRRIKEPFEACLNGLAGSEGFLTSGELAQIEASIQYTPTLLDQKTGTYRVVIFIPQQATATGDITGGTATWEVNLLTGEITPVDADAQDVAADCPALA